MQTTCNEDESLQLTNKFLADPIQNEASPVRRELFNKFIMKLFLPFAPREISHSLETSQKSADNNVVKPSNESNHGDDRLLYPLFHE